MSLSSVSSSQPVPFLFPNPDDGTSPMPDELRSKILGYLNPTNLDNIARTCKDGKQLADQDILWLKHVDRLLIQPIVVAGIKRMAGLDSPLDSMPSMMREKVALSVPGPNLSAFNPPVSDFLSVFFKVKDLILRYLPETKEMRHGADQAIDYDISELFAEGRNAEKSIRGNNNNDSPSLEEAIRNFEQAIIARDSNEVAADCELLKRALRGAFEQLYVVADQTIEQTLNELTNSPRVEKLALIRKLFPKDLTPSTISLISLYDLLSILADPETTDARIRTAFNELESSESEQLLLTSQSLMEANPLDRQRLMEILGKRLGKGKKTLSPFSLNTLLIILGRIGLRALPYPRHLPGGFPQAYQDRGDAAISSIIWNLSPPIREDLKYAMWRLAGKPLGNDDWAGDQLQQPILNRRLIMQATASLIQPPEIDLVELMLFVGNPAVSDEQIRSICLRLDAFSLNGIKGLMWKIEGERLGNPRFAQGQSDWAGDQLRMTPLNRQLLLQALGTQVAIERFGYKAGRDEVVPEPSNPLS